jgi:hypothetical protein
MDLDATVAGAVVAFPWRHLTASDHIAIPNTLNHPIGNQLLFRWEAAHSSHLICL